MIGASPNKQTCNSLKTQSVYAISNNSRIPRDLLYQFLCQSTKDASLRFFISEVFDIMCLVSWSNPVSLLASKMLSTYIIIIIYFRWPWVIYMTHNILVKTKRCHNLIKFSKQLTRSLSKTIERLSLHSICFLPFTLKRSG